ALPRFHARKSWRYVGLPVPSTAVLGACAVLVVAAGAAAVFTTISTPARVAPVQAVSTDFQAIADAAGLEGSGVIGGFPTPSGSLRLPFGLVRWTSAGRAHSVASIAVADAATGTDLRPRPAAGPRHDHVQLQRRPDPRHDIVGGHRRTSRAGRVRELAWQPRDPEPR